MKRFLILIIGLSLSAGTATGAPQLLDFSLHKLQGDLPGNTLLVVGGIQGDEPGGFNAASLLVTHYRIHRGNVWVVPNLNFISIIKRSRGIYGDLNRKFAAISGNDPEYVAIKKIKSIIIDKQVDMVLNLHDGSGFYHPEYLDKLRNPNRWGQCVIIDQERIACDRFGHLLDIANRIAETVNSRLLHSDHLFRVKNTRTREGDAEMAKTLTYFAARHLKPAFGVEASKSFLTHDRAYYHLRAIEAFMNFMGIEFQRKFSFSAQNIKDAIDKNVKLAFYDRKIFLDVHNARNRLNYVPLKKNADIEFTPSNPLITVVDSGGNYRVFHGNRRITHLSPQYFEYDSSLNTLGLVVDGGKKSVRFGDVVGVKTSFLVVPHEGYRVNVIGFRKKGLANESGVRIVRDDIEKRFSIDKSGWIYRVEVYREDKFSGMILVDFSRTEKDVYASRNEAAPFIRLAQIREWYDEQNIEQADLSQKGR